MKTRYHLICRRNQGGAFCCVDTTTGKRSSLETSNEDEARQIYRSKESIAAAGRSRALVMVSATVSAPRHTNDEGGNPHRREAG